MSTRIHGKDLRYEMRGDQKRALVSISVLAWDGEFDFTVGVPVHGDEAAILEDVRQRLLRLFQDAASTLGRDGLSLHKS